MNHKLSSQQRSLSSDSFESFKSPKIQTTPPSLGTTPPYPDHHQILQEMTLHTIHSRLMELDLKMNRMESGFRDAFFRLESNVASCQRAIEQVSENLVRYSGSPPGQSTPPQNMVLNVKMGSKDHKQLSDKLRGSYQDQARGSFSLAEDILSSPGTSYRVSVPERKRSSVLSKIKHQVKNAFSVPCVVTPIFEIYPAKMFPKPQAPPIPTVMELQNPQHKIFSEAKKSGKNRKKMSLEQIFFNDNPLNSNESLIATELNTSRRLVPLTEELKNDRNICVPPEVLEQLNSLEQRMQNVEVKVERLHEICEECVQSVQVEYGSELMSTMSSLPLDEEENEQQILKYISKEDAAATPVGSKDVEVVRSESITDLYERMKAEERVREANFRRLRRGKQFQDLLLNGALTQSRCQRHIQEDLLKSMSRSSEPHEKICKFD